MLENLTWNLFEKTGSVEVYLEYINIKNCNERMTDENKNQSKNEA